jgi:DNA-binding beta-propeller fold protein YncE
MIARALFVVVVAATGGAAPVGSLDRIAGRGGCISPADVPAPCRHARELRTEIVISPDGRSVYTIGGIDSRSAIAVLRRDGRTGALEQLRGRAGCVHQKGRNCTAALLINPRALVVTADGREVVWANHSSPISLLIAYRRARSSGALSALPCGLRCVTGTRGLQSCAIALAGSRDGRNLYATCGRGLAVYARDAATGRIAQLTGARGCIHEFLLEGCANPRVAPFTPGSVVVSNDGSSVYALSSGADAVYAFTRDRVTGALTPAACYVGAPLPQCRPLFGLETAYGLDLSRDGRNAYVVGRLSSNQQALVVLARQADGALVRVATVRLARVFAGGVTVAPDAKSVYVTNENGVEAFARARNGRLSRLPGSFGRLRLHPTGAYAARVVLSPDGRYAYIATGFASDANPNRIIVLRRRRR